MNYDDSMDEWVFQTDVGVLLLDGDRRLRCASIHARRLLGCASSQELNSRWPDLLPRIWIARLDGLEGDRGLNSLDFDVEMQDGAQPLRAEVCPTGDGYLVLIKDRNRIGQCEAHLVRSSQIEALHFLTSTIIHDFSAPLHNLQLSMSLLQAATADGEGAQAGELQQRCQRYAGAMHKEVVKLCALVRQLPDYLTWSNEAPARELDIRPVIEEVARLIKHEGTARRIRSSLSLPPEALMVHGDGQMLKLALLDLLIVLVESCATGASVQIRARANDGRAEIDVLADHSSLPQSVVDKLPGAARPTSAQTTGLTAARLIIESHRGEIGAVREPGTGVCFHLSLPLVTPQPA